MVTTEVVFVLQLFMGTFCEILNKAHGEVNSLKQRLEHFYSRVSISSIYNGVLVAAYVMVYY